MTVGAADGTLTFPVGSICKSAYVKQVWRPLWSLQAEATVSKVVFSGDSASARTRNRRGAGPSQGRGITHRDRAVVIGTFV